MEKTLPSIGPGRCWPGRAGSGVVDMGRDYTHLPRVAQFYSSPPDRAGIRKRGWHGEGKLEDNPTTSEAENWNGKVENAQGRICACRGGNPRGLLGTRNFAFTRGQNPTLCGESFLLAVPRQAGPAARGNERRQPVSEPQSCSRARFAEIGRRQLCAEHHELTRWGERLGFCSGREYLRPRPLERGILATV